MNDLSFECLWQGNNTTARDEVKALWRRYRALEGQELLDARAREIVFVVRTPVGEAVGVSTARPVRVPLLNNHYFYEFRCFVAPPFRVPGLDSRLAVKTRSVLEQQPHSPEKFKGLIMIISNEDLKTRRTKAVWPASGMVFAGYTSEGHHIRVGYFKGARI